MFHSTTTRSRPIRQRTAATIGGLALVGVAGAGLSGGADAATSSQASRTLAAIKQCESGGDYSAQNATTTASGAYQFLDTTWRGLAASHGYAKARYAPKSVQDAAALELYRQAGTSPWVASSSCWAR